MSARAGHSSKLEPFNELVVYENKVKKIKNKIKIRGGASSTEWTGGDTLSSSDIDVKLTSHGATTAPRANITVISNFV